MKARDEAKLSMYDAVIAHANANPLIVATVPAFQAAMNSFIVVRSSLVSAVQLAGSAISGIAMDKSSARSTLSDLTISNAGALFAYASSVSNNELKEKARVGRSKLDRMRDELLKPFCQEIHDLANANLAALAPFGVSAASLALYQAAIDNYDATVAKPRNAVSQRRAYKETIKSLFKQGDSVLKNQLDKLAEQFKAINAEFYNAYKSNREILDAPVSSTRFAGTVSNSSFGSPLTGVLVKNEAGTETATTDTEGKYELKIPVPGTYTILFTKDGFHAAELTAALTLGNTTDLDASLTPL